MKIAIFFILMIIAALIGGIYGALYEQITYTISPEFFSQTRLPYFKIPITEGRWGAAKAGFMMVVEKSLLFGGILAIIGFIQRNALAMFRSSVEAFLITIFVSFLFAMFGFALGPSHTEMVGMEGVADVKSFSTVIRMNNFSLMGGLAGMLLGVLWQVFKRKKRDVIFSEKEQPGE